MPACQLARKKVTDSLAGAAALAPPPLESDAGPSASPVLHVQAVATTRAPSPAAALLHEDVNFASGISAAVSGSERKVQENHETGDAQWL